MKNFENRPLSKFTDEGRELVENSENISDIVIEFINNTTYRTPENLAEYPYVGSGKNSIIYQVDQTAIKFSSKMTSNQIYSNMQKNKPENLINQMIYLNTLRNYLKEESDGTISIPNQYFALKNKSGDYLKAEELMHDWITISEVASNHNLNDDDREIFSRTTKSLIIKKIGSTILRLGLNDSGINKNDNLHGGNILIPKSTIDLDNPKICIIDQPSKGLKGRLSVSLIKKFGSIGLKI